MPPAKKTPDQPVEFEAAPQYRMPTKREEIKDKTEFYRQKSVGLKSVGIHPVKIQQIEPLKQAKVW